MLQELYQYSLANELTAKPGYTRTKFKAYVCLTEKGNFLGIDPPPPESVLCPSMGSAAQGTTKCNVPVEKSGISLTNEKPQKHSFFIEALKSGASAEPLFGVLVGALENPSTVSKIRSGLEAAKVKAGDKISYKVDGKPLEQSTNFQDWWDEFRVANTASPKTAGRRCFITGKQTEPLQTVDPISGLISVGGHSRGDSLICFDKPAFCSYNFKKTENATVSAKGIAAVNAALENLLKGAIQLAGAKWLHWYEHPISKQEDLIPSLFGGLSGSISEEDGEDDETIKENITAKLALQSANKLIESARSGERPERLRNQYYILSLSGASGRVMVRSWFQGSYEELYEAISKWYDDLELCNPNGKGVYPPCKLFARNIRLLKVEKDNRKYGERMNKELAGLEQQIIFAIIKGNPLPDSVAYRALQYIRSDIFDSSEEVKNSTANLDPIACQWLKIWLNRKLKQEGGSNLMKESCNPDYPSGAYQAGRMMAVYAAIQVEALGKDIGAGVIQRYYTSASTSPALVMGRLSTLSQHHLSKMENRYWASRYEDILGEITAHIGDKLPVTLNLKEQSEFALGYYQQRALLQQQRYTKKSPEQSQTDENN